MNSNEEIFFSVFSSNSTETSRGATKKHLRASVSKRHVKIFLTCERKKEKKKTIDHNTQKSQTTSLYTEVQKDNTNGRTISGGSGVTSTATLVMTTATIDALQVLKRGKRCSRRK